MKNIILAISLLVSFAAGAQTNKKVKTETFKVFGNCGQCKERIESALDAKGIISANWNVKTKQCEVVYKTKKINTDKIHELIAASGHDTELKKAPDSVYFKLPDCCLYRENPNTHDD